MTPDLSKPDWKHAAADFVSARLELFALEGKSAVRPVVTKAICGIVAGLCAVMMWGLLVIGMVGWISDTSGWPWYGVTLLAALLHLIIAGAALMILKRPGTVGGSFPLSRNELTKDREWLNTLKNRRPN